MSGFGYSIYSEDDYQKMLVEARRTGDLAAEASALSGIGIQKSFYDENGALHYYFEALQAYEATNNMNEAAATCQHIGNILKHFGEWEQAISYYERTLAIAPDPDIFQIVHNDIEYCKQMLE